MRHTLIRILLVIIFGAIVTGGVLLFNNFNAIEAHELRFENRVIVSEGRDRVYMLGVPSQQTYEPVPLLVVLHGGGSSAEDVQERTDFETAYRVLKKPVAIAYPEGTPDRPEDDHNVWNAERCCDIALEEDISDAEFLSAVVTDIANIIPIRSVSVVGFSNGAMMATHWACHPESPVDFMISVDGGVKVLENCERRDWSGIFFGFNNELKPIPEGGTTIHKNLFTSPEGGGWDTTRFQCQQSQGGEHRTRTQLIEVSGYYDCAGGSFKEIWNLSDEHAWPTFSLWSEVRNTYESFEEWVWHSVP
ncbi:MAG: hypothetical protein ACJKTH_02045 [Patescibacteria group bacterium UBA2163]